MADTRDPLEKAVDRTGWKHTIAAAVAAERERCAKIAEAHRGSAAAKRRTRGQQFKFLPDEAVAEIQAEERGEDIAAEMIARAIRAEPH